LATGGGAGRVMPELPWIWAGAVPERVAAKKRGRAKRRDEKLRRMDLLGGPWGMGRSALEYPLPPGVPLAK
jgi:hypothetical protein